MQQLGGTSSDSQSNPPWIVSLALGVRVTNYSENAAFGGIESVGEDHSHRVVVQPIQAIHAMRDRRKIHRRFRRYGRCRSFRSFRGFRSFRDFGGFGKRRGGSGREWLGRTVIGLGAETEGGRNTQTEARQLLGDTEFPA